MSCDNLETLIKTIEVVFHNNSSHENRVLAFNALENFKESSPNCAEMGFLLSRQVYDVNIRHYGLQCIEHVIKYKWNDISTEGRLFVKKQCFYEITQGLRSIMSESGLIKEAMTRCIVEMVKREWPQNWPSFFEECLELTNAGDIQSQIVLGVFLRLIEDVVTLENMQGMNRRRDLYEALVLSLPDLLKLCSSILETCFNKIQNPNTDAAEKEGKYLLAKTCLQLFSELLDWVPSKILTNFIGPILTLVCSFLPIAGHDLRLHAAVCIWQLASRKAVKCEELKPVLSLFHNDVMVAILAAAQSASQSVSEEHYVFLKTICGSLVGLGSHLCTVWDPQQLSQQPPPQFKIYFQAIFAFFVHPSMKLRNDAATVFCQFLQHDSISKNEVLLNALPDILAKIPELCQRVGLPNLNDHPSCQYSRFECDDEQEFLLLFTQTREKMLKIIRLSQNVNWKCSFELVVAWINQRGVPQFDKIPIVEWEAMNRVIKVTFDQISKFDGFKEMLIQEAGIALLDGFLCCMENCDKWTYIDQALSAISSLFIFMDTFPDRLENVLNEVFRYLSVVMGNDAGLEGAKAMKQHALNSLLKVVTDYPHLAIPKANDIFLMADKVAGCLSLMQQGKLIESLGALSNHLEDVSSQKQFLRSALATTVQFWTSQEISQCVSSPESFIKWIGLIDKPPTNETEADALPFKQRRRELRSYSQMWSGLLMQVKLRDSSHIHPIFELILPCIPNIFLTARCLNGIYARENLSLVHPDYGLLALDVPEVEKHSIRSTIESMWLASLTGNFEKKTPQDFSRAFLAEFTETIHLLIGQIVTCDSSSFYSLPSASQLLLHGSLGFVNDTMDLRLRFMLRRTWKPIFLSLNCMNDQIESCLKIVMPSLILLLECVCRRLQNRWETIEKWAFSLGSDAEPTAQETFLEDSAIVLTREATLLLKEMLLSAGNKPNLKTKDNLETTEEPSKNGVEARNVWLDSVNPLGVHIISNQKCRSEIVVLIFKALTWRDSISCRRAIPLCLAVLHQLLNKTLLDTETANHLFYLTLASLTVHGHDENMSGSLINMAAIVYEKLRVQFPSVKNVLAQIPGCAQENIDAFDTKLDSQSSQLPLPEKLKKDMMKKIVKGIVSKNVGDQFKRHVHLKDLPPLLKPNRIKTGEIEEPNITLLFK